MEEANNQPSLPHTLAGDRIVDVVDAPEILDVAVQVVQSVSCGQAVSGGPFDSPLSGDVEGCVWWATALPGIFEVDLTTSPTAHERNLLLESCCSDESPLEFVAPATVKVWYE